jgi:ABC-2 type transport system ATP-binding protein
MEQAIIDADGLTKRFNGQAAIADVTFEVPRGAIFGYVGPSGSGKTTTIRVLTGVYTPTAGTARVLGYDPARFHQSTRERIGYMPQLFVLYPQLTVWENLNFAASLYGMGFGRGRALRRVLDFVELSDHRNKRTRDISGGMQRRLSLAATLVHDPELLFLDEPTAGIDPVLRRKFWDHFKELQKQGRTLFITTQYVSEVAYCDLVGVMAEGRLLVMDTPEGLRNRAMGGDVVNVRTTSRLDYADMQALAELPYMRRPPTRAGEDSLRLVVDRAATAIPALFEWFNGRNINISDIEEYQPPFDDVFVELVKKEAPHD